MLLKQYKTPENIYICKHNRYRCYKAHTYLNICFRFFLCCEKFFYSILDMHFNKCEKIFRKKRCVVNIFKMRKNVKTNWETCKSYSQSIWVSIKDFS